MRRCNLSTLAFAATGLVGPLVRWATWPPSDFEQKVSPSTNQFVYDLVFLLWPAQPLAVIEVNTGQFIAGALAVGVNVLLFCLVGGVACIVAKRRFMVIVGYVVVCALISIVALWNSGFTLADPEIWALVGSFFVYAVPVSITFRLAASSAVGLPR